MMDDFINIMITSKIKSRVERPMWLINGFREAILDVGLLDIHMEGTLSSGSRVYVHHKLLRKTRSSFGQ